MCLALCAIRFSTSLKGNAQVGQRNWQTFGSYYQFRKIQGEHKVFPWLQTFITRKLPCTSFRRVSTVDNFPARWCTSTLGFTCSSVFGCNFSKQVDWKRWSDTLATAIAGYHPLDFFLWGYVKDKVFSTPVPDITNLKAKNKRRFCYNNWRHVGENVERNWLSIRCSPCNKRSTCRSVLMCCKKTSWVELHFGKKNVCIPRSFLVINVCNRGKTLWSPCTFFFPDGHRKRFLPCSRRQGTPARQDVVLRR